MINQFVKPEPPTVDTYLYNVDCQWIDITDLTPGVYQLKVWIETFSKH